MAKVVGDVAVSVGADVTPLKRGMRQGSRELGRFSDRAERTARRMARVGAAIATALAAGSAAAYGLAARSAELGKEVGNLSRLAGTAPREFQRWAIAADTVGISQEKLADILKDMQDRVGDFLATEGGPMKDFFENIAPAVGVTADQFARLSGPEALQLYVSSLEKANLTQNEMTFYMEALASDSTALIPLLRDNGRALRDLGDEAEAAGRIMSNETVRGAADLDQKLAEMHGTISNELTSAMIGLEDELLLLSQFVKDYGVPAIEAIIEAAAWGAQKIMDLAKAIAVLRGDGAAVGADVADSIGGQLGIDPNGGSDTAQSPESTPEGLSDLYGLEEGDDPGLSDSYTSPLSVTLEDTPSNIRSGRSSSSGSGGGGGRGRRGPTREDLDRLREGLASEREIIEADYQERLEKLQEYREAEILKEGEFADTKLRIEKEHKEAMEQLQKEEMRARLDGYAGMFGDLSALMQSENKKLFAIGKAASIAQATVKGYEAAVEAWDKGMKIGGPPVAAAFTAASLAKTGMLISNIASTSASGGGGGGGGAGAAGGAQGGVMAPAADPAQQVNINIGDAQFFPRSAVIQLAEELRELSEDGAIVTVR